MSTLVITSAIRQQLLAGLIGSPLYVGFGSGLQTWGSGKTAFWAASDGTTGVLQLPHTQVRNVSVGLLGDEETLDGYQAVVDRIDYLTTDAAYAEHQFSGYKLRARVPGIRGSQILFKVVIATGGIVFSRVGNRITLTLPANTAPNLAKASLESNPAVGPWLDWITTDNTQLIQANAGTYLDSVTAGVAMKHTRLSFREAPPLAEGQWVYITGGVRLPEGAYPITRIHADTRIVDLGFTAFDGDACEVMNTTDNLWYSYACMFTKVVSSVPYFYYELGTGPNVGDIFAYTGDTDALYRIIALAEEEVTWNDGNRTYVKATAEVVGDSGLPPSTGLNPTNNHPTTPEHIQYLFYANQPEIADLVGGSYFNYTGRIYGDDYLVDNYNGRIHIKPSSIGLTFGDTLAVLYEFKAEPENIDATALVSPKGYKKILIKYWVQPRTPGQSYDVTVNGVNYEIVEGPTRYVYLSFLLETGELSMETIREVGIFTGLEVDDALPDGQVFFTPDQVEDVGTLYALKNFPAIIRTDYTRERFEQVISF